MALEALLAQLDADAREERAALLAEAEDRAEALRKETERELARKRRHALEAVRADAAADVRAEIARARAEARRMVFQGRQEVLDRVRRATEARITEGARAPAYRSVLPAEVADALARAPEGPLRLEAPPDLAEAIRDALDADHVPEGRGAGGREPTLEVVRDEATGTGFVVVADEGRVVIDATLSARLDRIWSSEAMRLLRELDR